jgi:hypothetical protein
LLWFFCLLLGGRGGDDQGKWDLASKLGNGNTRMSWPSWNWNIYENELQKHPSQPMQAYKLPERWSSANLRPALAVVSRTSKPCKWVKKKLYYSRPFNTWTNCSHLPIRSPIEGEMECILGIKSSLRKPSLLPWQYCW